ncbi:hypothetical protein ACGFNU_16055 [Spirillospora sp. NPDC048911]|uniref:hypothetical protein n=1 Tax=Spirillospora sp. NPDC048911 TaxID=3364527 RepID=UPI00371DC2BD
MRVRKILMGASVTAMVVGGFSVPAQAADFKPHSSYPTRSKCVDAGQQYVRENYNAYKCTERPSDWLLWLK